MKQINNSILVFIAAVASCLVLLTTSCSSPVSTDTIVSQVDTIPVIDVAKAIENAGKPMLMSEFIEDIEYIRPEYPASLVDMIFDVNVDDNYLLLQVRDRLYCYSRQGKFLREIGRKGQGPEEHLGVRSSTLYNGIVAINSNYRKEILRYDIQGNYLGQSPVSGNVFKINMLDTNRVAVHLHHGTLMDNPNLFVTGLLNSRGDTIQLIKTESYYSKGLAQSPSVWNYADTVRVFTCINDTVYSVSRDTIAPKYIINFGKHKVSKEAFADIRVLSEERNKYIYTSSFGETSQHLLMMFPYDGRRWMAVYDKSSGKMSSWNRKADEINRHGFIEGGGWENDIDGGANLTFLKQVGKDYLTLNMLPEELRTQFYENKKAVDVKYPEKQEALEELIKSLDDDENPVVILYKLKR